MNAELVAIIGSATRDTIVCPDNVCDRIGGVVTYAGLTYKALGIPPVVVSNIAPTDTDIATLFQRSKIPLVCGNTERTTRFVNYYPDDARHQEVPAVATPIDAVDAIEARPEIAHIHLGPLHPADISSSLFSYLSGRRLFVSMDAQGYVRRIHRGRVYPAVSKMMDRALRVTSVLKVEIRELDTMLAFYGMTLKALQRHFDIGEILVTSGESGGYALDRQARLIAYRAAAVERVIRTVGAGDVFFAAYLAARHHQRLEVEDSLDRAAEVAGSYVAGEFIDAKLLNLSDGR